MRLCSFCSRMERMEMCRIISRFAFILMFYHYLAYIKGESTNSTFA